MLELKTLYEDRAEIAKEIRRLADISADPNGKWTAECEQQWEAANADYNQLSEKIEKEERAIAVESSIRERREQGRHPGHGVGANLAREENEREAREEREQERCSYGRREEPTVEDRALALQAWCRVQAGKELTEEHRAAIRRTGINPGMKDFEIQLRRDKPYSHLRREYRAQSTAAGAGGETIPEGFVNNFERAMLEFGGMRQVADILRTASGNDMPWPTTDDTGNKGAILGENTQVTEQDITTGAVVFNAFKYTSKLVKVSAELLEDSAFDLANVLGELLGERVGRITNDHFTTGTGASQPNGIITAATVGVTAASGSAITSDEILELLHSVDPAYRPGGTFMLHDQTVLAIRKLKDAENQYLWQPGLQLGQPDRLLGFPVVVNQSMAEIALSAKVIAFGALSKYKIRDVAQMRLRRLTERFAEFDQEAFVAFTRHDGDLLDAGTNPVKVLQMAAA